MEKSRARKHIGNGTQKLSDIVGLTLGPRGRNVVLERENGTPLITNDGVTIARSIKFQNKNENIAAQILLQASSQTNQHAGDGTTSAIVLGAEVVRLGTRAIELGACPMKLKDEILGSARVAVSRVEALATPVNSFEAMVAVATNSCANPDDGEMVARAFEKVGSDGVVSLVENASGKTTLEHRTGCEVRAALATPYMIEDAGSLKTTYDDARVLLVEGEIKTLREILPLLEVTARENTSLVIIANGFSPEVLNALVVNRVRAGVRVVALVLREDNNRRNAVLGDIAALTGAVVVSQQNDLTLERVEVAHLGHLSRIECGMEATVLHSSRDFPAERIQLIRTQIVDATDEYTKTRLEERLARLTKGIAVISVGAPTDIELREKKLRIEDAIAATKAATNGGVVAGGGTTYLRVAVGLGSDILARALESVTRRIMQNCGENPDLLIPKILENQCVDFGFDGKAGMLCDLRENNIVDPAKVITSVITNATSAAATLLTTEAIVLQ